MKKRLEDVLRDCTARVEVPGCVGYGTGFFIAHKVLITCRHVVDNATETGVRVYPFGSNEFLSAKVMHRFRDKVDLAVLQISSPLHIRHSCVYVGHEIQDGDKCFAFGYTEPGEGFKEGDPVTLECEGIPGGAHKKIKLKGGQVLAGLSGSPLLNKRTGSVCGVIYRSRSVLRALGGEAISTELIFSELAPIKKLHDDFHSADNRWLSLLKLNSEPFLSDWTYLEAGQSGWIAYIQALKFLICTSIKWLFLGFNAPRAFPIKTIQKLFEYTLKGNLGVEINRQRDDLTRRLGAEIELDAPGQAKVINQLSSQSSVLRHLINILVSDEQSLASISRLAWASDLLYEQHELLEELKSIEGNSYPSIERLRTKLPFLRSSSIDNDMYLKSDKIISSLVTQYTDTNFLILRSFNSLLAYCVQLMRTRSKVGVFCLSWLIYIYVVQASSNSEQESNYADEYADITNAILLELESSIGRNPKLKVLNKVKVLLESVAGEPITGGRYRAWNKKGKYHFSRRCKFYPERVRPREMKQILCYDSVESAELSHQACSLCTDIEKKRYSEDYFIGKE